MAVTHTHARMLKHKYLPSTPSLNRSYVRNPCMILTIQKCLMQHMQNATKICSAILKMACEMLQLTSIRLGIELQMQLVWCAAPGACKTDEWCKHTSISMLIETCLNLTIISRLIKGRKTWGWKTYITHKHTYYSIALAWRVRINNTVRIIIPANYCTPTN